MHVWQHTMKWYTFNTHGRNDNRTWLIIQQFFYFQVPFFSSISINESKLKMKISFTSSYIIATHCPKIICTVSPTLELTSKIFHPKIKPPQSLQLGTLKDSQLTFFVTSDQCFCILIKQSLVHNKLQSVEE